MKQIIETDAVEGVENQASGAAVEVAEKPYTFRGLNGTDLFLMSKILGKIGIKELKRSLGEENISRFTALMKGGNKKADDIIMALGIDIGMDAVDIVLNNLPKCEDEVFKMLENTSNLTVAQIKQLSMAAFAEMVIDFIKKEDFKDFFRVVSKSF